MNLKVSPVSVIFTFFFIRGNFMCSPFVGLAQVDVVGHSSVPDALQSLFVESSGSFGFSAMSWTIWAGFTCTK